MYLAMNRFKVEEGREGDFENVWKGRKSTLHEMDGFVAFHLMRGPHNEEGKYTLFASHTTWKTEEDFLAWTKSENFRDAHKNAGNGEKLFLGHPQFEGFNSVEGA